MLPARTKGETNALAFEFDLTAGDKGAFLYGELIYWRAIPSLPAAWQARSEGRGSCRVGKLDYGAAIERRCHRRRSGSSPIPAVLERLLSEELRPRTSAQLQPEKHLERGRGRA